jgi:hypothetical protein
VRQWDIRRKSEDTIGIEAGAERWILLTMHDMVLEGCRWDGRSLDGSKCYILHFLGSQLSKRRLMLESNLEGNQFNDEAGLFGPW